MDDLLAACSPCRNGMCRRWNPDLLIRCSPKNRSFSYRFLPIADGAPLIVLRHYRQHEDRRRDSDKRGAAKLSVVWRREAGSLLLDGVW
jgi:hypothetical protein